MNILQGLVGALQTRAIAPHVGETFFIWRQYVALIEGKTLCQTLLNHTSDPELREFIRNFMKDAEQPVAQEFIDLMKREGVEFPSMVTEKTDTQGQQIPAGAHFSDQEIAHMLIGKFELLTYYCYSALSQTLRNDLGLLFLRTMVALTQQGNELKQLADKRGWLLHPPPFAPVAPH